MNRFFELLFCGSNRACTGALCTRWTQSIQGDDGDLWRDLTLRNNLPDPRKPPVPKFVHFPCRQFDDVSTLYEGSLQHLRYDAFDPSCEEKLPDDLELRVETSSRLNDDESNDLEVERRFFAELCSTPLTKRRSQRSIIVDGDGSSYSTHRQHVNSWKTGSTDTTMPKKNRFTPFLTSTQAMV